MHSFFSATLQKDRGKNFLREHEDDFDDQTVFKKSHVLYVMSAGAQVNISNMLSCITSARS